MVHLVREVNDLRVIHRRYYPAMVACVREAVERPIFGLARRKLIQKYRALRALNDRL